jgi:hypothetical protein
MGLKKALEVMLESMATGKVADRPDLLVGIEDITRLVGYERISKLKEKYGGEERDYAFRKQAFPSSSLLLHPMTPHQ